MRAPLRCVSVAGLLLLLAHCAATAEAAEPSRAKPKPTAPPRKPEPAPVDRDLANRVAQSALSSLVVISHFGREGKSDGVGAGFVVNTNGLVATSLHVISEGRPMLVQTSDGAKLEVVEIVAWDRHFDLALLRVRGAIPPALPLGDSESLRPGDEALALGNPMGLKHSVVRGVISARREVEGVDMIQVAIPIEPGNSGGPLLDFKGQVQGVMALKSVMTANLGFAVPVNALKLLIERPNPVSIDRWLNMGALDAVEWEAALGARWRQRVDRISVEGLGDGFGGRSLCLSRRAPPQVPFEVSATVKMEEESGAAGLVFASDGGLKHYGFYPTGGQLRLTRFDGANVFSWTILEQKQSPHYRKGEWNRLRVRVEKEQIRCFVNDNLVFSSADHQFAGERVGLCKFRDTKAEFKGFSTTGAGEEKAVDPPEGFISELQTYLDAPSRSLEKQITERVRAHDAAATRYLDSRAAQLERDAAELRRIGRLSHARRVEDELKQLLTAGEQEIDLVRAALLVALYDDADLNIDAYRKHIDRMGADIASKLPSDADERGRLKALKDYFYKEQGFHGSRHDYYDKANSYLNLVVEQREGIPITLSILFMELGHRIGLSELRGHPLPGHFMVLYKGKNTPDQVIDVFEGGRELTHAEADLVVGRLSEGTVRSELLEAPRKRDIVVRMIRNLLKGAHDEEASGDALRYLDLLIALQPTAPADRLERARLRAQLNDAAGAKEDIQWLLDHSPPGVELDRLEELLKSL
ncbi:MAG: tetratricopeptide repeat protein [Verrucomicrobia bacterium]|nr:tetratricopeptide repeat protein [Verrucomicrobiota bacterium]